MPKALLYQISTRSWIAGFGKDARLPDVPFGYWKSLAQKGYSHVWLMGVWQTTESSVEKFCFHPDLTAAYSAANPDWSRADVWGSPYAIDDYVLHKRLGEPEDLAEVHRQVNQAGLQLILDFVPNHFNAFSSVVAANPTCFMLGAEHDLHRDPSTYYRYNDRIHAHGKDPYFPAWTDTCQVDYSRAEAHNLLAQKLEQIAAQCDGVRCDMAMLVLPDIFSNTWSRGVEESLHFWRNIIPRVKTSKPFTFIAESYWDREEELQQLGFDYTYDKKMLDLLHHQDHHGLEHHFSRPTEWHRKSVKFVENHDEDRSMKMLGRQKAKPAAVMALTAPGMALIFAGQERGYYHRVPVQLALESKEYPCPCSIGTPDFVGCWCQAQFYERLLHLLTHVAFNGEWEQLHSPALGTFVWRWHHEDQAVIVAINYTSRQQHFHLPKDLEEHDLLNNIANPSYLQQREGSMDLNLAPFTAAAFSML